MKHHMQNIEIDDEGTARFTENKIVSFLLETSSFDMNYIYQKFYNNDEDLVQFYQLLGYDVFGCADLHHFSDEVYFKAHNIAEELLKENK